MFFDYSSNLAFTFFHAWESKRKHSFMVSIMLLKRLMGIVKLSSFVPTYGRTDGSSNPMKHLCPCRASLKFCINCFTINSDLSVFLYQAIGVFHNGSAPQPRGKPIALMSMDG